MIVVDECYDNKYSDDDDVSDDGDDDNDSDDVNYDNDDDKHIQYASWMLPDTSLMLFFKLLFFSLFLKSMSCLLNLRLLSIPIMMVEDDE